MSLDMQVKYSCGCLLIECITHLFRYIQLKLILQSRLNVMSSSLLLLFSLNNLLTMFATRFVFVSEFRGMVRGGIKAYCLNI